MLRTRVGLVAAIVGASLIGMATATAGGADAFRGEWTSVDTDGSRQWLSIEGTGAAGAHAVRWIDESATAACGGEAASVQGEGEALGDVLSVTVTLACRAGGNPLHGRIDVVFLYTAQSDTLTDGFGVTWTRS